MRLAAANRLKQLNSKKVTGETGQVDPRAAKILLPLYWKPRTRRLK
jgi:hypothetical protein